MADRIPLIINSSAQQIQELPSGDSLTGITNIAATGTITGSFSLSGGSVSDPSLEVGTSNAGVYGYESPVTGLTSCFALTFPAQAAGQPGAGIGTWGLIGYNMGATAGWESILIGSIARANPPKNPKTANNDTGAEGLHVTNRGKVNNSAYDARPMTLNRMGSSTTGTAILSFNNNGTECGKVRITGSTSVAYDTSSDYRLKENVVDLTGARARLDSLKVKRFNFIADSGVTVDGFLAHEAQTVVPEAVSGSKDQIATQANVDADEANAVGDPMYQGIDQSKLVPLLTAALQEAFAEIDSLKARITALE